MIHLSHVTKTYSGHILALADVSLQIQTGEMAFLTGHSGAGKSTLLKLLMMTETVTEGKIIVNSTHLSRINPQQVSQLRRHIGLITQNTKLIKGYSVFENVALPLLIRGYRSREIKKRVNAALHKVELIYKHKFYPDELSCGEWQRVAIARAVVNKPLMLIADEPTASLDPELTKKIITLFEAFNRIGVTVLIATHNRSLINDTKYRVFELKTGVLQQELSDD